MSKKLFIGIISGLLAGLSIRVIMRLRNEEVLFSDEDMESSGSTENDMLDKANNYLLFARKKVNEIVKEAEAKSSSILEEAGIILSRAKDKTARLHFKNSKEAMEELNKIREELEKNIKKLEEKNLELSGSLEYLNSGFYQEREARLKFGLQKPEEKVIIIAPAETQRRPEISPDKKEKTNFIKWWEYFFK